MHSLERQLIRVEMTQRREEGCDVSAFEGPVQVALADENTDEAVFGKLYDELDALQPASSFPYQEPSELEAIRALRPDGPRRMDLDLTDDGIRDRIHGAWLGRAAGCSLGKPVEGWPRKRIDDYLESMGALPLDDYIPFKEGSISPTLKASTRDNIEFMARDDVMGLAFGAEDYENGIVVTVRGGWDTDCNGATVGSILGAKFGADALPEKWTGVLSDRLMSCVRDCNDNRISELAERTHRVAMDMLAAPEEDDAAPVGDTGGLPGTWTLDFNWGKPVLTVNDDLSGQVEYTAYDEVSKIRDVRVDGKRVRFVFGMHKGETEVDVEFVGTISGDRLAGDCTSGGFEFAASAVRRT